MLTILSVQVQDTSVLSIRKLQELGLSHISRRGLLPEVSGCACHYKGVEGNARGERTDGEKREILGIYIPHSPISYLPCSEDTKSDRVSQGQMSEFDISPSPPRLPWPVHISKIVLDRSGQISPRLAGSVTVWPDEVHLV